VIILDTNVISEVLRPTPVPRVLRWVDDQPRASLFITTVTRGEILYGIQLLADGKRKRGLWDVAKKIFDEDFAGQMLSFDSDAADFYAEIAASRWGAGRPISQFDAMIAAMARSRGADIATRNVKDFAGCGIGVANPWEA
jgi:predicted nucleic acid-binding protein